MALWCRIKQSNLKLCSRQFCRSYFQISGPCLVGKYTAFNTRDRSNPDLFRPKGPAEFAYNVRFFAAPVQVNPKKEKKDASAIRINEQIMADMVRLIIDEGGCMQNLIVTRSAALKRARELELDLVEVQRSANPPVCKIMDFHLEKYKKQLETKKRAKTKVRVRLGGCKEVKFTMKTELKDLKIKADMVKRMMERGYRVRCEAEPATKRTEDDEGEDLSGLLSRFSELIEDVSLIESGPLVEKSKAYMVVRHVKFGPTKKGKKGSKSASASSNNAPKDSVLPGASSSTQSPILEEDLSPAESGLETQDDETLSDEENHGVNEGAWSVNDADDNFDQVFDLSKDGDKTQSFYGEETDTVSIAPSSPTDVNISDILHPRPALDSKKVSTVPHFLEPPVGNENRYKRSEQHSSHGPTKPAEGKFSNVRENPRLEPPFRYQGKRQPLDLSDLPSSLNKRQSETDSSIFKNLRVPNEVPRQGPPRIGNTNQVGADSSTFKNSRVPNGVPCQGPSCIGNTNQGGADPSIFKNSRLPNETPSQGPSQKANSPSPSSNPPVSGYGIFSAPKSNNAPGRPGVAAEGIKNRDSPTGFTPRPRAAPANSNSPTSRTGNCQRSVVDRGGRGQWGIFSGDGSNAVPKSAADDQAKAQR